MTTSEREGNPMTTPSDPIRTIREALLAAAKQFRDYEEHHAKKGYPEKAERNAALARQMEAALALDVPQTLTPAASVPVAWRVKDFADDWILYATEAAAKTISQDMGGALIEPLYASVPSLPAEATTAMEEAGLKAFMDYNITKRKNHADKFPHGLPALVGAPEMNAAWKAMIALLPKAASVPGRAGVDVEALFAELKNHLYQMYGSKIQRTDLVVAQHLLDYLFERNLLAQPEPHGVRMSAAKKDAEDHEKWKEGWDAAMNWCEVNDLIKDDVVIPKYTPAPEPADGGTPGWIGGRVRPLPDSRIGLTLGDTEHVLTHTQAVAIATRLFAASPAVMEKTGEE